jgi:hypothetical protein
MRRLIPLVLVFLSHSADSMGIDRFQFESRTNRTALIELYTSEGCSSCPPAEESFSRLKTHPRLWLDFVPVAFHVDYWDYLGWRDLFGAADYSERQRAYAAEWKSRSIYTPGFVLDGKESRGWLGAEKLPNRSQRAAGVLKLGSDDGSHWMLRFEPASRSTEDSLVFYAVLLGFDLTTNVKAGENRGRKLQHDFVVLSMSKAASGRSGEAFEVVLSLARSPGIESDRRAVVGWVCRNRTLEPVQAVGGWLRSTNR